MRPGFHHSWQAAGDSESELQADVMRFVAIVALCIVAISSLVEEAGSPEPPEPPQTQTAAIQPRLTQDTKPVIDRIEPMTATVDKHEEKSDPLMVATPPIPPPTSATVRTGGVVPITSPVIEEIPVPAKPATETPVITQQEAADTPNEPQRQPPTQKKGFTLRFESDAAFLRLVSAGEAALFVFGDEDALRLVFDQTGARFRTAPQPRQFHAIAPDTVPATLQAALAESGHRASDVVWGVTLPAATRSMLAGILRNNEGGELVIRANGDVFLENNDA